MLVAFVDEMRRGRENDYAVKDVEILCSFSRRDGGHLTDRRRILPDTIGVKGRRTFNRLHIGFVNVNADKVKCVPLAARPAWTTHVSSPTP